MPSCDLLEMAVQTEAEKETGVPTSRFIWFVEDDPRSINILGVGGYAQCTGNTEMKQRPLCDCVSEEGFIDRYDCILRFHSKDETETGNVKFLCWERGARTEI